MTEKLGREAYKSLPPYPYEHSGPVLVCGNAWCLPDDYERARVLFPDAPVIAINGASREVKAFALYTWHPDRLVKPGFEWIARQKKKFGDGFTVHGSRYHKEMPWVQYWWADAKPGGGGSAWGARKVAYMMGFDPVILCGCPLVPGNYAGDRPGQMMTRQNVIDNYTRQIAADKAWHEGCYSMSGETMRILGSPKC